MTPIPKKDYGLIHLAIDLALETIKRTPMRPGDETYFGRPDPETLQAELLALRGRCEPLQKRARRDA